MHTKQTPKNTISVKSVFLCDEGHKYAEAKVDIFECWIADPSDFNFDPRQKSHGEMKCFCGAHVSALEAFYKQGEQM